MYTSYNSKLDRDVVFLHPGEYYSTYDKVLIGTLLGSCISVVLYDPKNGVGGLNHFMLPSSASNEFYLTRSGKYGMYAMELLINSLMKNGVDKSNLKAKIFGGSSVLKQLGTAVTSVAKNNIDFAFNYLKTEGIPVVGSDVGGVQARKIFLYPENGKILLKRIGTASVEVIAAEENAYLKDIKQKFD